MREDEMVMGLHGEEFGIEEEEGGYLREEEMGLGY